MGLRLSQHNRPWPRPWLLTDLYLSFHHLTYYTIVRNFVAYFIKEDMIILIWLCLSSFLFTSAYNYQLKHKSLYSRCDFCLSPLNWHHMVPLFSFVLLKGRCATCKEPIDPYHFLSELVGLFIGLVFTIYKHSFISHLWMILLFYLFFCDLLHQLIPNRIHLFFLILNFNQLNFQTLLFLLVLSFFFLFFVKRQMFGMGDVKLIFFSSLAFSIQHVNLCLFLSSACCLVVILLRKKDPAQPFPFGCCWAIGLLLLNHLV